MVKSSRHLRSTQSRCSCGVFVILRMLLLLRVLLTLTTNSMLTAVALNDWLRTHTLPLYSQPPLKPDTFWVGDLIHYSPPCITEKLHQLLGLSVEKTLCLFCNLVSCMNWMCEIQDSYSALTLSRSFPSAVCFTPSCERMSVKTWLSVHSWLKCLSSAPPDWSMIL